MFGSKRRSMIPTVCRTHLPIHLARIAPLIQVAAKTAGAVHRADVLIFVKSMIYIQGADFDLFPGRPRHHPYSENAALVSNISRKVGRRAGRV